MIIPPSDQVPCQECPAQLNHQRILLGLMPHPLTEASPVLMTVSLTQVPNAPAASAAAFCRAHAASQLFIDVLNSLTQPPKASSRNMLRRVEKKPGKAQCCPACRYKPVRRCAQVCFRFIHFIVYKMYQYYRFKYHNLLF